MTTVDTLLDYISTALPAGLTLRAYHLSTPPSTCPALFSPALERGEEPTLCESHFIGFASPKSPGNEDEVLFYALEVLIYSTPSRTTLFVSKADSSGFLNLLKLPASCPSIVGALTNSFLEFSVATISKHSPLVLSLFARSQNQYLFPGSIENPGKHLLDDRHLIKWWCRIFDNVIRSQAISLELANPPRAHLVVPGCDPAETRAFLPLSARTAPTADQRWINGYPLDNLPPDPSAPIRSLIPRFPDDPKARFLDDLDGREVDASGNWRSVKSLEQFWEMMSYRQECSAGRLVGFLWAIFGMTRDSKQKANSRAEVKLPSHHTDSDGPPLPTPAPSQVLEAGSDVTVNRSSVLQTPPSSSPPPPTTHIPNGTPPPSLPHQSDDQPSPDTSAMVKHFPKALQGELQLDDDKYQALLTHLLDLDFATEEVARSSTASWIGRAAELADVPSWGKTVVGRATVPTSAAAAEQKGRQLPQAANVNVLTSFRKKRKADVVENAASESTPRVWGQDTPDKGRGEVAKSTINTLGSGLIRKKPKT